MKVLVTGNGQLAQELNETQPSGFEVRYLSRSDLDITDGAACLAQTDSFRPDWIINAAAYTAVDKAETDRDAAFDSNANAVENLAIAAKLVDARLLHISTDFVFDGTSHLPYKPDDGCSPLGVYGESKYLGEQLLGKALPEAVIIRTAWVYSCFGNNFVKTMIRLMKERPELGIISDQIGTPTWAKGLAHAVWNAIEKNVDGGIYHWTDAGVASWYDFAVAIQDLSIQKGLLSNPVTILPIKTSMYPTPAKRPSFSVLDKEKIESSLSTKTVHWRQQLSDMLDELVKQS